MDLSNRLIQERTRKPFRLSPAGGDVGDDVRRMWRVLLDRKSIIFGTVLIVTALVTLVAFQIQPRFTATTQILIDPHQTKLLDVQSIFAGLTPESGQVESQVHVIRSQALLQRLVDQLKLVEDPEFNPDLQNDNIVGRLTRLVSGFVPKRVGAAMTGTPESYLTRENEALRLRSEVIQEVGERLRVRRNATTFVIDVDFTSVSQTKAAKIANTLADLYIVDQLETKFEQTRRATDWLNEKLETLRADLRASEEAVEAFRAKHNLVATLQAGTFEKEQLAGLQTRLVEARIGREEAEVRLQQIREISASGGGLSRAANVVNSELLASLRAEDAKLYGERESLAMRYGPRHPKTIEIESQRRNVQAKMREEVRRVIQELENNVEVAKASERALEQSLGMQQVKSGEQNQLEIQLRQLALEAESNRQIYESFLQSFKSLTDQDAIQQSDARVISVAPVPRYPSFPKKKLMVAGGFVFSLLLGMFLALFVERLDHGVRAVHQLEGLTNLRNIAVIPTVSDSVATPHDYVLKKPLSAYSEAIRALHNTVVLSASKDPLKVIVVTSSLPGEGKSTVSLSLARLAARSGRRTVLVDCDFRRPNVASLLEGVTIDKTMIDVLEATCSWQDAVVTDSASGLRVLPARDGGDRSPDLINSEAMRGLIKELREAFDLVVVDSPPILPVGDTLVLSRLVDAALYVVRWQVTPRDAVASGLEALGNVGANIVGTALSQVDFDRYTRYTYGDAGSHYRRYQGYYVD